MANRYETAKVISNVKKIESDKEVYRRRFSTVVLPDIEESEDDIYAVARAGDRLDLLAKEYYGDETLWWWIAQANNIGKGTWHVEPGTIIRIPASFDSLDIADKIDDYNNNR